MQKRISKNNFKKCSREGHKNGLFSTFIMGEKTAAFDKTGN